MTWNTTVFSLNVIDNFRGEGWGWLHYYIITATYNKSVITATLRWLCNNQKRKTKDDLWIFYDRRKGMSYHHAKHTAGQTAMCYFTSFPYWIKNVFLSKLIRQENVDGVWHLIGIQHKNSHLKHSIKIHIMIIYIPPNLLSRTY